MNRVVGLAPDGTPRTWGDGGSRSQAETMARWETVEYLKVGGGRNRYTDDGDRWSIDNFTFLDWDEFVARTPPDLED